MRRNRDGKLEFDSVKEQADYAALRNKELMDKYKDENFPRFEDGLYDIANFKVKKNENK